MVDENCTVKVLNGVKAQSNASPYVPMASSEFKTRYHGNKIFFGNICHKSKIELSKYIWNPKTKSTSTPHGKDIVNRKMPTTFEVMQFTPKGKIEDLAQPIKPIQATKPQV